MNPWAIAIFSIGFVVLLWDARRRKKRDEPGSEDGEGGNGGGGGWTDKPSGKPPGGGGPDRDIDRMFHEVADAIGKSIKIDEKDKEKVLL